MLNLIIDGFKSMSADEVRLIVVTSFFNLASYLIISIAFAGLFYNWYRLRKQAYHLWVDCLMDECRGIYKKSSEGMEEEANKRWDSPAYDHIKKHCIPPEKTLEYQVSLGKQLLWQVIMVSTPKRAKEEYKKGQMIRLKGKEFQREIERVALRFLNDNQAMLDKEGFNRHELIRKTDGLRYNSVDAIKCWTDLSYKAKSINKQFKKQLIGLKKIAEFFFKEEDE